MSEQVYYEDIDTGNEIGPLIKQPTTRQLVIWAGVSGDYNPIHYDKDYALSRGLSGVIVQGQLAGCFLGQLVTDWMGSQGELTRLNCNYKGMNYPGETLTCRGKVTGKFVHDGRHLVECNLWVENSKGEKTVSGKAVVALPSRD